MSQFKSPLRRKSHGTSIALNIYLGMFVTELFSFFLLSFAGLLCLSGLWMMIDGITRLIVEWHQTKGPRVANGREQEEKTSTPEKAA
jgi:hypothetical protein